MNDFHQGILLKSKTSMVKISPNIITSNFYKDIDLKKYKEKQKQGTGKGIALCC